MKPSLVAQSCLGQISNIQAQEDRVRRHIGANLEGERVTQSDQPSVLRRPKLISPGIASLSSAGAGVAPGMAWSNSRRLAGPLSATARPIAQAGTRTAVPWVVRLFLITLVIPWIIWIGPMRLSLGRAILMVTLIPSIMMWLDGKAGRIRAADIFVILFSAWSFVSLAAVYDVAASVQSAGMIAIETMGSYFLARTTIRNAAQFRSFLGTLLVLIALILPFSVYESVTGQNLLLSLLASVLPTQMDYAMAPRWGLRRVQSVFDHPILSGVFAVSLFSMVHRSLGYGAGATRRWFQSALISLSTLLAMSSGPLSALGLQMLLLGWDQAFRRFRYRWWVVVAAVSSIYLSVSLLSNQSFFAFYVHYFAFNQDTGWDRIRIWIYGWQSINNHPLFGIGFNEYERPEWMEPSIDMFWLVNFVSFGYPGGLLMLLVFGCIFTSTALKTGLDEETNQHRIGYLISLLGIFTVGWTVHFWNTPYLLVMFCLGAGSWILDEKPEPMGGRSAGSTGRIPGGSHLDGKRFGGAQPRQATPIRR